MLRPWPLTGREAELRRITAAARPGAAGILVVGPAGVGKTRLVREAVSRSGTPGVWALASRATTTLPLGAFAGLVDVPTGDASSSVGGVLAALARRRPLVLGVDDAHLLDELSAVVVHRAVARGLFPVVVTVRGGEPVPDLVTALWKDEMLARLDLAALDLATTRTLVARVLGGPVESASARRLWALTRGSPLFLRHLLPGEVAAGRLSPASGIWCWSGDPHLSRELAALIEREIGALEADVRDVVDVVTLGEPLALDALVDLTGAGATEEAERRGLVRTHPTPTGPVVRLAHPLYGEVRRGSMGTVRARRLRGLLAVRLDPDAHAMRRAVLTLESDLPPDPGLWLRAAEEAIGFHDLPLAERLARAAATAGGAWRARLVHASALSWLTRGEEAEAVLRGLVDDAPDGPARARLAAYRAGNLLWTLRRADDARAVLAVAASAPDVGRERVVLDAMTAAVDAATGDADAALARALPALRHGAPDDLTRVVLASVVAAVAAVQGRVDLLDEVSGGPVLASVGHTVPVFGLVDWLVLGYRLAGATADAGEVARGLEESTAQLSGPAHLMGLVLAGHAAFAGGRVRDAEVPLREAWAGLASTRHEFRFRCRTLLVTAYALAGRSDDARPLLEEMGTETHPAYALLAPDDLLARAWAAGVEGALTSAVGLAVAAASLARAQASPALEVAAWQVATQLGGSPDAVVRLDALRLEVAGPRAELALRHARAWAAADADALAVVARGWEEVGDLVAAGDAHAQAGDVLRRRGRPRSALTAVARANELAQRSGACTPAITAAVHPVPLTPREREVALLAAHGLSNREIAERLTVSVRTAEGHLYRAGLKLGVSDRADLATVLAVPPQVGSGSA
ncbi:helix-turn-helix transcriptional regulator [Cellulomonas carbonis]|uniref:LuxR family transcriptional regulator n=1 Tax=Cellulomonas carbonis T26 TaxID=947969 RepID=A0A0A0BWZ3_9CELL|nr:LuxR family transcriptional regulator [Cellulomonas carbonis]KGM11674.1 LuxR family transcriptional regulator [Cellulomonas carbonis T26]GGB99095.1 LuxR family transcriptional regulator [Cellulomonas carbonis]